MNKTTCPECGGPKHYRARRCHDCHVKHVVYRNHARRCADTVRSGKARIYLRGDYDVIATTFKEALEKVVE